MSISLRPNDNGNQPIEARTEATRQRIVPGLRRSIEENTDRYRNANRSTKEIAKDEALKKELSKGPLEIFFKNTNTRVGTKGIFVAARGKKDADKIFNSLIYSKSYSGKTSLADEIPYKGHPLYKENKKRFKANPNIAFYYKWDSNNPDAPRSMISLKEIQELNGGQYQVYAIEICPHNGGKIIHGVAAKSEKEAIAILQQDIGSMKKIPIEKIKPWIECKELNKLILAAKNRPNSVFETTITETSRNTIKVGKITW